MNKSKFSLRSLKCCLKTEINMETFYLLLSMSIMFIILELLVIIHKLNIEISILRDEHERKKSHKDTPHRPTFENLDRYTNRSDASSKTISKEAADKLFDLFCIEERRKIKHYQKLYQ